MRVRENQRTLGCFRIRARVEKEGIYKAIQPSGRVEIPEFDGWLGPISEMGWSGTAQRRALGKQVKSQAHGHMCVISKFSKPLLATVF